MGKKAAAKDNGKVVELRDHEKAALNAQEQGKEQFDRAGEQLKNKKKAKAAEGKTEGKTEGKENGKGPEQKEKKPAQKKVMTFADLTARIKEKGQESLEGVINSMLLKGSTKEKIFEAVSKAARAKNLKSFTAPSSITICIKERRAKGWIITEDDKGVRLTGYEKK